MIEDSSKYSFLLSQPFIVKTMPLVDMQPYHQINFSKDLSVL